MKHLLLTTIAVTSLVATTAFAGPIHDAAETGNLSRVQAELEKGVDVNAKHGNGPYLGMSISETPPIILHTIPIGVCGFGGFP
jgi:hypothetical protein